MKLQIKDSGAWRNVLSLTEREQPQIMAAATSLLLVLNQPKTAMRLVNGDLVLDSCSGPTFLWHGQHTCDAKCPAHAPSIDTVKFKDLALEWAVAAVDPVNEIEQASIGPRWAAVVGHIDATIKGTAPREITDE